MKKRHDDWKLKQRYIFYNMIAKEKKESLLEIGAGTGRDSKFFLECGFDVTAIDISTEMVKKCKEKGVVAYELDVYNLLDLETSYDCIFAMDCLIHIPRPDFIKTLNIINAALKKDGLFYMGVYGGLNIASEWKNNYLKLPRFCSFYSEQKITQVLQDIFDIILFEKISIEESKMIFYSIIMRKK
jgi:SAM-dependent methyltransferase